VTHAQLNTLCKHNASILPLHRQGPVDFRLIVQR
jgi:hypothetical protein